MKTPAQQIKKARKQAGLTQQDLSNLYGIPKRTVEDWDRGAHEPPDYLANLLIDRIKADFMYDHSKQVLSAPKEKVFTDDRGKPLKEPLLSIAKEAFESNKVQLIDEETFEGAVTSRLYMPTEADGDEIPFGFIFKVKEV